MLPRHNDRQLLGHQLRLALPANSRRVDKTEACPSRSTTSSTASRVVPGNRRHDRALASRERIQQCALAYVRSPDDRNLRLRLSYSPCDRSFESASPQGHRKSGPSLILLAISFSMSASPRRFFSNRPARRKRSKDLVQQVAHAGSMLRRDRQDVSKPKRRKFSACTCQSLDRVHLVHRQKQRFAARAAAAARVPGPAKPASCARPPPSQSRPPPPAPPSPGGRSPTESEPHHPEPRRPYRRFAQPARPTQSRRRCGRA